jgi:hypothetical protein
VRSSRWIGSPGSLLAPYENPDALNVARDLDDKVEDVMKTSCSVRRNQHDVLEVVMDGHLVPASSNSTIRDSLENLTLDTDAGSLLATGVYG